MPKPDPEIENWKLPKICPVCGSHDIIEDESDSVGEDIFKYMFCGSCWAEWSNHFEFTEWQMDCAQAEMKRGE